MLTMLLLIYVKVSSSQCFKRPNKKCELSHGVQRLKRRLYSANWMCVVYFKKKSKVPLNQQRAIRSSQLSTRFKIYTIHIYLKYCLSFEISNWHKSLDLLKNSLHFLWICNFSRMKSSCIIKSKNIVCTHITFLLRKFFLRRTENLQITLNKYYKMIWY